MTVKMIIATSSKEDGYAIGANNKLLCHIPEDLEYFKLATQGSTVVMGRSTFDSLTFKNGLPMRKNIVLSRNVENEGKVNFTNMNNLIETLNSLDDNKDVWVIGGKQIYTQLLSYVDEVHHSTVKGSYPEADTHMDMDFLLTNDWYMVSEEKLCDEACVKVWRRV